MKPINQQKKRYRVSQPEGYPAAPFPMCFTKDAMAALLTTVATLPPETGAKGFGPPATIGFDVVEFDSSGSADADFAVYRPSAEWGSERQKFHLDQPGEYLAALQEALAGNDATRRVIDTARNLVRSTYDTVVAAARVKRLYEELIAAKKSAKKPA